MWDAFRTTTSSRLECDKCHKVLNMTDQLLTLSLQLHDADESFACLCDRTISLTV